MYQDCAAEISKELFLYANTMCFEKILRERASKGEEEKERERESEKELGSKNEGRQEGTRRVGKEGRNATT